LGTGRILFPEESKAEQRRQPISQIRLFTAWGAYTSEINFLTVLEVRSLESRCWQA
jgi:hypothetical protein